MSDWGPFSLDGKSAVITGGAMGIGFGIARRFLDAGARVLLADIDEGALERALTRLAVGRERVAGLSIDLGTDEAPDLVVAKCVDAFGSLDVLVNNAGIYPQVPAMKMTPALFDKVLRINLRAPAFLSQAAARRMLEQGRGGKIINIGSIDSLHPSMVGLAAYDASKHGILGFTKSFALELAPSGIQVNAILPGGITTEGTSRPLEGSGMTAAQQQAMIDNFVKTKVPVRRMGAPDDIAGAAVFLASRASDYMSGSYIVVDGGALLT